MATIVVNKKLTFRSVLRLFNATIVSGFAMFESTCTCVRASIVLHWRIA